jgi:CRISPR-associated endonuclease/helicase Cas3
MMAMGMKYYAHSLEGRQPEDWQPLEEHLNSVAEKAGEFAEPFFAKTWALILGRNHDLGKGTRPWQAYLRRVNNIIDEFSQYYEGHPTHAFTGAKWLYKFSKDVGKLMAYCIAGHHGGLPNWDGSSESNLKNRMAHQYAKVMIEDSILELPTQLPFSPDKDRFGFQLQFFVRMLFSCLVDADYLDTEAWLNREKSKWRGGYQNFDKIHTKFWNAFNMLREEADKKSRVNIQRESVLHDCIKAAEMERGFFSLTVPTGGGKTLASMAFALNYAVKHSMRRIIYVIPFTSIIEQNAKVFRDMIGDDSVLEHHCNFIPDDSDWKTKLASENWDAPVVVTTNVQFFNSFYANKPSKCRKLHNVSESIVIFDEVQAIPVEKLKPCLEVINELTKNYGVTTVLCTATQPAIQYSDQFQSGLKNIYEIVQDVPALFSELKRTEEEYIGELNHTEVADRLAGHKQVLCIVNTRQQALDTFNALPKSDNNIHLSALMYPAHRKEILEDIRRRLNNGKPCRVVSTQLIEAGVDVDFPCVYRTVAGIDSIAQAAGRCNRNGASRIPRKVLILRFPEEMECSYFRQAAQSAAKLFKSFSGDLTSPECVHQYFIDYFWKNEQRMDSDRIVDLCLTAQSGNIQFRDIAEFEMIKTATIPVIIALQDDASELVRQLKYADNKGGILRRLQQYTVQVYSHQFSEICDWLEKPIPGVFVLNSDQIYSEKTGLQCKPPEGQAFFG